MVLYVLVTMLLWASAYPMGKLAQVYFPPVALSCLRCFIAGTCLFIIGRIRRDRFPKWKDMPLFIISGLSGYGVYLIAFHTGLETISAGLSSILLAIAPILSAVWACWMFRERLTKRGWLFIFTAFLGVALLVLWDDPDLTVGIGILWTLLAAIIFSFYNVLTRKLSERGYHSIEIATYHFVISALFLSFGIPDAIEVVQAVPPEAFGVLFYLALCPSALACILWAQAIRYAGQTSGLSNYMFLSQVFAIGMSFLILGEVPTWGTLFGGVIIVGSMICFQRYGQPTKPPTEAESEAEAHIGASDD